MAGKKEKHLNKQQHSVVHIKKAANTADTLDIAVVIIAPESNAYLPIHRVRHENLDSVRNAVEAVRHKTWRYMTSITHTQTHTHLKSRMMERNTFFHHIWRSIAVRCRLRTSRSKNTDLTRQPRCCMPQADVWILGRARSYIR